MFFFFLVSPLFQQHNSFYQFLLLLLYHYYVFVLFILPFIILHSFITSIYYWPFLNELFFTDTFIKLKPTFRNISILNALFWVGGGLWWEEGIQFLNWGISPRISLVILSPHSLTVKGYNCIQLAILYVVKTYPYSKEYPRLTAFGCTKYKKKI